MSKKKTQTKTKPKPFLVGDLKPVNIPCTAKVHEFVAGVCQRCGRKR